MLKQGKHAVVKLKDSNNRIFKTYDNIRYVNNEYYALKYLANIGVCNLNPKKEAAHILSLDWIPNIDLINSLRLSSKSNLVKKLVDYIKTIHTLSFNLSGEYLNHRDLFEDNIILKDSGKLLFIDWGLSRKSDSVYPDIASILLGFFNESPNEYKLFLNLYFGDICKVDFKLLENNLNELYEEYSSIRKARHFEIDSLTQRLNRAKTIIKDLKESILN